MSTVSEFEAFLWEETSIRVSEEIGSNSPDWDRYHDKLMEDDVWISQVKANWIWRQDKPAQNDANFEKEVTL
jgi:hypothetical protein